MVLALLVLAIGGAIGGGEIVSRAQHKVLAIDALPRVQHQQVCAEDAVGGQALHHAGVVIVFPDGTDTYCVSFEEDELSGAELLQRTGRQLVLSGFGGLGSGVCRIDDVGCSDPGDCFCQCRGADCHYWTYFRLDSAWRTQNIGASQRRVHDGDVDGWVWGNGHTPPGAASIGALCSAVRPAPLPTATPALGNRAAATPTLSDSGAGPNSGGGAQQPTIFATQVGPAPTHATIAANPATTPEPRVVRQSSRPTSEVGNAQRDASGGGGVPAGLVAFGAVAGGLVVIAGGVVVRRRLRG
jgi:hypothetical protein